MTCEIFGFTILSRASCMGPHPTRLTFEPDLFRLRPRKEFIAVQAGDIFVISIFEIHLCVLFIFISLFNNFQVSLRCPYQFCPFLLLLCTFNSFFQLNIWGRIDDARLAFFSLVSVLLWRVLTLLAEDKYPLH